QERTRDLTGVRTGIVCRQILRAECERDLVRVDQRLDAADVGEGREHRHLDGAVLVLGVLERPVQLLHERDRLQVVQVHLPVARDQRGTSVHAHPSTSRPGSFLPSRNSRLAPPPVEMCPNRSSAKPSCRTAAAESPPPTTLSPSTSVSASATALVPAANAGNSNTP